MSFTFNLPDGSAIPIFFIIIMGVLLIAWIATLIEIINHEYSGNNKIIWLGLVLMMPGMGMMFYYLFGRSYILGRKARLNNRKYQEDEFV